MKTKTIALIALAMILTTLITACNSGDSDGSIRTSEDVVGRRIGVVAGSAAEAVAAELGEVTAYSSEVGMLDELRSGAIECALIEGANLKSVLKGERGVKELKEPLTLTYGEVEYSLDFCIIAAKQARDLTTDVNAALRTLHENGVLPAIIGNYMGGKPYTYVPREDIPASAGTLRLAVGAPLSKYLMLDENGEYCGIDIDVARAVCDLLGVNLAIVTVQQSVVINHVWTGKADFAMGAMHKTPKLEELVDFSNAYVNTDIRVIVRK